MIENWESPFLSHNHRSYCNPWQKSHPRLKVRLISGSFCSQGLAVHGQGETTRATNDGYPTSATALAGQPWRVKIYYSESRKAKATHYGHKQAKVPQLSPKTLILGSSFTGSLKGPSGFSPSSFIDVSKPFLGQPVPQHLDPPGRQFPKFPSFHLQLWDLPAASVRQAVGTQAEMARGKNDGKLKSYIYI